MDALKTISLTKYYGKSRGILDMNLTVEQGDFFGFIGPNGAGKSTTIRTLLGLIAPTSGSAQLLGMDILCQKEAILSHVGYMPSEASFYRNMRVKEIIKLSADLRHRDCSAEAKKLCERLELDVNKKIRELSLGNRKKVSIVCALQHMPDLCILDEPTSGLDPLMQREFYAILEERNQKGATIFVSSHILSEIQRYCRHAAVIREGRLLALDSTERLGHTDTKRVRLGGVHVPPDLPHMKDVQTDGDSVSFLYDGNLKELLNTLSALPLTDVSITEPDLEEIFMHYYEEEN
ncbi:MAG: ABC transporter ATP-binding protein [Dorea sp.]|uniref:ABC transporter ATP-binding protein n=1 Tax=Sporofaciens musculi TaxID=2681861 RepID=UPI0021729F8E|nr:ABC transporter ATP-binding protein [Sporofaciens musculi]MCI9421270.1 ABC transporter ATP-binding protein [Dorea sp.]